MKEEWKDIIGYEGFYKISNTGKVLKLESKKRLINGNYMIMPEKELLINANVSYPCASLNRNGKIKSFVMHRLMAIHFIPNDDPIFKREVNHINKNIFDFSLKNLEWCTRSQNMLHAKGDLKSHVNILIKMPSDTLEDLKQMAVKADKDLKNYIQDLLVQHVKKEK